MLEINDKETDSQLQASISVAYNLSLMTSFMKQIPG